MATSIVSPPTFFQKDSLNPGSDRQRRRRRHREHILGLCLVTTLTALAFAVHGYHPFAEDGGLYLAGIKRVLEPGMFPRESGFVLGHLRFSLFAPAVASIVRFSGLTLDSVLLLLYLASIWATLWAGWLIAGHCFQGRSRIGAVALLATWLTLPVAGTSLMMMDPYVTARSISTPCTLLALAYSLEFLAQWRQRRKCDWGAAAKSGAFLAIAALMHPLMAAYGFGCILALAISVLRQRKMWILATMMLCIAAIAAAAILQVAGQPESDAYRQVAMSRYYWFLSKWQWYEWLGLTGPIAILGFAGLVRQEEESYGMAVPLARMGVAAGIASIVVALLFAQPDAARLLVARLQPLRVFQVIYVVMILYVGAGLSVYLGNKKMRWLAAFAALGTIMFLVQREIFPTSAHIEIPSERQSNAWVRAFEWIRKNTPKDALFALDADYITKPGEDAQCFRAIAERSALPDYSKDGGEAAITPSLTDDWKRGQELQTKLSESSDTQKVTELRQAGVDWVVLARGAVTAFPCNYANEAVKVCRLPENTSNSEVRISSQDRKPFLPALK